MVTKGPSLGLNETYQKQEKIPSLPSRRIPIFESSMLSPWELRAFAKTKSNLSDVLRNLATPRVESGTLPCRFRVDVARMVTGITQPTMIKSCAQRAD